MQEFKTGRERENNLPLRLDFLLVAFLIASFLLVIISVTFYQRALRNKFQVINSSDVSISNISKNKQTEIRLFLAGDVMLGRTVMTKSQKMNDNTYPFRKVGDVMRKADIVFVNLENPIIDSCPYHDTGYVFCTDPSLMEGMLFAGVDVVNLANNHIYNYGVSGRDQTLKHLENVGILATGSGGLVKLERNGVTFGFLGFDKSEQVNPKLEEDETDLIVKSDAMVDVLVVAMHWGIEYQNIALPGVRSLAKEIVGLGADVIVGHHPHWVQDWELIDGKPVYYSLGNFIFDQMWSEETKKGLAIDLTYDKKGNLAEYKLLPTYMSSWCQPEFVKN